MYYEWVDYHAGYKEVVETWFDSEAVKYTGCDEGWDSYFEYWKKESGTVLNENFFGKVILDDGMAVGVMAVFKEKGRHYIAGRESVAGFRPEILKNMVDMCNKKCYYV